MQHEFLKFIPTPADIKCKGVAVIRTTFNDPQRSKMITRHKVMPSDKGGYWVNGAAIKTGFENGKDTFAASFQFDSNYENEELRAFVLHHALAEIEKTSGKSVFDSKPVTQQSYREEQGNIWDAPLSPPDDSGVPF